MRMLMLVYCFVFVLAAGVGCKKAEEPSETVPETVQESQKQDEAKQTEKTLEAYEIPKEEKKKYQAQISEFDLGDREYTAQSGKVMPYKLRGMIGVPQGEGQCPLVLITHGSHSNLDESKRFDTGFTYLVQALAENGYIAVSMDMSMPYIWKYGDSDDKEKSIHLADEHIKSLIAADKGEQEGYPAELADRIDFNKIALIGHSRGGDTIFDIALAQQENGLTIKALLPIAPIMPNDIEEREWPDALVSILVPEYDGDVVSLDGFAIDTVLEEKGKNLHAVTMLNGANHNYFNTNLEQNDALLARTEDQLPDQLAPKVQQTFLCNFALDFLQAALLEEPEGTMYAADKPRPNRMYGLPVAARVHSPKAQPIFGIAEADSIQAQGAVMEVVTDSWFYQHDKVLVDTVTFGQEHYQIKTLLRIQWDIPDSKLIIVPTTQDFGRFDSLCFTLVTDAADGRNEQQQFQSYSVELEDAKGNKAKVSLPADLFALRKVPGRIETTQIEEGDIRYWSSITPLYDVGIPLSEFEGVVMENIVSVSLCFDQSEKGALYLQSILLQ